MELIVVGAILCLFSGGYVGMAGWCIVQFKETRLYLGFALACGVALTVAAFCGIFSGSKSRQRRPAILGCLLFGTCGLVAAVPAMALTIIAMGLKVQKEVCRPCMVTANHRIPCNGVCESYEAVHLALIVLDALELVTGFVLCGAACCAICCKTANAHSPSSRGTGDTQSWGSTLASFD